LSEAIGVAIVPIEFYVVSPLWIDQPVGGGYANDASVLRGDWLCGGSLAVPARGSASRRSGHAFSVSGVAVERFYQGLGALPVASPFRLRAHCFLPFAVPGTLVISALVTSLHTI